MYRQQTRQTWENTLLSQLELNVFPIIAQQIASQWKMIAYNMNIDPNESVMPYTSSRIPIELASKMLAVAAKQNKTVGDLNDALKKQLLSAYVLSESDVPPVDIPFSKVTLPRWNERDKSYYWILGSSC